MAKKEKQIIRERVLRVAVINIKVSPKDTDINPNVFYQKIFEEIRKEDIAVNTRGDKFMDFFSMNNYEDKCIYGKLAYYTLIDPEIDWYNRKEKTFKKVDIDPYLSPNVKNTDYFFIPDAHRFCLLLNSNQIAVSQVIIFLEKAIQRIVGESKSVEVIEEKSIDAIQKILTSESLLKLEINISYTNDDLSEDFAEYLDQDLKDGEVRRLGMVADSFKKETIQIQKSNVLKGALNLSKSNGYAEAVIKEGRKNIKISTKNYPMQEIINSSEGKEHIDIYNRIMRIFRNDEK